MVTHEIHLLFPDLLKDDNMPLKVISDFCGFTNQNSPKKFFRRETGMSKPA